MSKSTHNPLICRMITAKVVVYLLAVPAYLDRAFGYVLVLAMLKYHAAERRRIFSVTCVALSIWIQRVVRDKAKQIS